MNEIRRNRRRKRRDNRRANRKVGTSRHIHRFLRSVIAPFLAIPFHLTAENRKVLRSTPKPFIILGNHSSVLDPFIVAVLADAPIQYVVSDSQFRNRLLSFVLGLVGSIPKTKVISDLETVKNIVRIKNERGIIGIFPEGQSSWDGHSLPIVKSTFKLIKSLKIPVITARLNGAYLTWPRWSPRPRRGKITVVYERILDTPTIRALSLEEIERIITEKLDHDESEYQRTRKQRFSGARQAEYLERVLFICPSCGARHTMVSRRKRFSCTRCGYSVHFSNTGFFEARSGTLKFDNIRAWNTWQLDEFKRFLEDSVRQNSTDVLLEDGPVTIRTGYKTMELQPLGTGSIRLYADRIELHPDGVPELVFPIHDVEGINVQNNEKLEFYVWDDLYRVETMNPRGNTYKWFQAVQILQSVLTELDPAAPHVI